MPTIEYEGDKDRILSTQGVGETMADILSRRFSRRTAMASALASGAAITLGIKAAAQTATSFTTPSASPIAEGPTLGFDGLSLQVGEDVVVPEGYTAVPFLRWGDPLFPDAPAFNLDNLAAAAQTMQVGYNCDYIGWISLPPGSDSPDNGLLVINHEYTNPELMFPGYLQVNPEYDENDEDSSEFVVNTNQDIVDYELESHGLSVVEVKRTDNVWEVVLDSQYNRRITATTPTLLTGPAAGDNLVKTSADPTGTEVVGTLNNCAGGTTPWGTVISGEENFNQYFAYLKLVDEAHPTRANHERFALPEGPSERL